MSQNRRLHLIVPLVTLVVAALGASWTMADDMVSFATGGYARGLRTMDEMHKIDKVFDMMDKNHGGSLGPQDFLGK
jgi:hypothetical protein